jgi:cell division protein FtsL
MKSTVFRKPLYYRFVVLRFIVSHSMVLRKTTAAGINRKITKKQVKSI